MSTSKPSKETVFLDVPEVDNFSAKFKYNFYTENEGVSEVEAVPQKFLERKSDNFNTDYVSKIQSRIPKYVIFSWKPIIHADNTTNSGKTSLSNNGNLIKENLSKILDENLFSYQNFTTINLSDQSIDRKLHDYISGVAVMLNETRIAASDATHQQLALQTNELTSDQVEYDFLSKYLVQPSENNVFFYAKNSERIKNESVNKLKNVNMVVQLNNKFISAIVKNSVYYPQTTMSDNLISTYAYSINIQKNARARSMDDLLLDDYKSTGTPFDTQPLSEKSNTSNTRLVGYIIDKFEILQSGELKRLQPIIIEDNRIHTTIDLRVKYYGNYQYSIRTISEFTVPSIVEETNEIVVAKFLVSSKPSQPVVIRCIESKPPPPPADINLIWDYDEQKLKLNWAFPANPQRDIKKFQVFRRKNITEPFQLLAVYDFDNSAIKAEPVEYYFPNLVKREKNPLLIYTDDEFTKDSKYIYTLCSIDAHGMTSNYGIQMEVNFNKFKNKLVKKMISSSGAPKAYPNMYLNSDTFVDSINTSNKRKMTILFKPEHLNIIDTNSNNLNFMQKIANESKYVLQFINIDSQKEQRHIIKLIDRIINEE